MQIKLLLSPWAALVLILLAPSLIFAGEPQGPADPGSITLSPYLVAPAAWPSGDLVLRRLDAQEQTSLRLPLSSREPILVRLPLGSVWEISGEIPNFWLRRSLVTVDSDHQASRIPLALWPLGKITGKLRIGDPHTELPPYVKVSTLDIPAFLKRPPVPPGVLECPLAPDGTWTCSLPVATFDLVVSVDRAIPHYFWGVAVTAEKPHSLGTLELKPGASVAGWVAVEGGAITDGCVARLAPAVAGSASAGELVNLARTAIERPVRKDGFFQVAGLAPGTYSLEILQPGFTPARLPALQIPPGVETFLREPLLLTRSIDLTFEIAPPLDWLGRPWRANVTRLREAAATRSTSVFDGAVAPEGVLRLINQPAGRFQVRIQDSLGNTLYFDDRHLFESPDTPPQRITIDLVDVEGTLRVGRNPAGGTLWFGGRRGAQSVRMDADEKGNFAGVLPRGGIWVVDVEVARPTLRAETEIVVEPHPSGRSRIAVDIPDTRLFGRVISEDGKPVAGAFVTAEGENRGQTSQTNADGEFEIQGLHEGLVRVAAGSPRGASDWVYVPLEEENPAGPVELRLRKLQHLSGTLSSPYGPVAGARIVISPFPSTGAATAVTTGADGSFSADIPSGYRQVVLLVSAPGFPFKAMGPLEVDALSLVLSGAEGGALELNLPDVGATRREALTLNLFAEGLLVPLGVLRQWSADQGESRFDERGTLRFPNLAPGVYTACFQSRKETFTRSASSPEGGTCVSGSLTSGGVLSLAPVTPAS